MTPPSRSTAQPAATQPAPPPAGGFEGDPLLDCLEALCAWHGRPRSAEALVAGLPVGERADTDIFARAAARAGFRSRMARRALREIDPHLLPCVLLLAGRRACLLLAIEGETAEIADPAAGGGSVRLSVAELETRHTGGVIFVRPQPMPADTRALAELPGSTRAWFLGTLWRFWPLYGEALAAAFLINLFMLATPVFIMNVYDRVLPNAAFDTLWALIIGMGIVFVFDFLLRELRSWFVDEAGRNADVLLAARLFEHVLALEFKARPRSAGAFASQLREFDTLRDFLSSVTFVALVDLPFALLFILAVWLLAGTTIAAIPAIAFVIVLLFGMALQRPLDRAVAVGVEESARRHGLLVETIFGLDTIKAQAAEGQIQRQWEQVVDAAAEGAHRMRLLASLNINVTTLVTALVAVVVVLIGVYQVSDGDLTMGGLIAAVILSGRALTPIGQVAALLVRYNQARLAYRTLDRILKLPLERSAEHDFLHRPALAGELRFDAVTFTYPGQQRPAIEQVSFHVRTGERVAVLGRIGAGKTTVFKLVMGLFHPDNGAVLFDGTDIRQIDPADLRRAIGYVPQDVFLFSGSVRDNILLGRRAAGDEEMVRAARVAGVDAFVGGDAQGYDRRVGERGEQLSAGQRQSIGIARALVGDPAILLLDEPTSHIDSTTEAQIITNLRTAIAGRTVLLVTHRLQLLDLVDRIIVVDGGHIVADGPKAAVLQTLSENARGAETGQR